MIETLLFSPLSNVKSRQSSTNLWIDGEPPDFRGLDCRERGCDVVVISRKNLFRINLLNGTWLREELISWRHANVASSRRIYPIQHADVELVFGGEFISWSLLT